MRTLDPGRQKTGSESDRFVSHRGCLGRRTLPDDRSGLRCGHARIRPVPHVARHLAVSRRHRSPFDGSCPLARSHRGRLQPRRIDGRVRPPLNAARGTRALRRPLSSFARRALRRARTCSAGMGAGAGGVRPMRDGSGRTQMIGQRGDVVGACVRHIHHIHDIGVPEIDDQVGIPGQFP